MAAAESKRTATVETAEETTFLTINRVTFHEILYSIMQNDFDRKVRVAQLMPFWKVQKLTISHISHLIRIKKCWN